MGPLRTKAAIVSILALVTFLDSTQGFSFDLGSRGAEECFEHEAAEGVHGLMSYVVVSGGAVDVTLRDAAGRILHRNAAATFGEQAFTTPRAGRVGVCFKSPVTGMAHHTIRFRFIFDEALAALDKTTDLPERKQLKGAEEILRDMFIHAESVEYVQENVKDALDRRLISLQNGAGRVQLIALIECLSALALAAAQVLYIRSLFSGKGSTMGRGLV